MISLILAFFGSCAMSWFFKEAGIRRFSTRRIAFFNYLIAAAGLWTCYGINTLIPAGGNLPSSADTFTVVDSAVHPFRFLLLAVLLALSMVVNLIALTLGTAECGMNKATFFNRIGFLTSMLLALICWKEYPTLRQVLGISCLIAGLFAMTRPSSGSGDPGTVHSRKLLSLLCISSGFVIFFNALYGRSFSKEKQVFFLALVFTNALLMSSFLLFVRKKAKTEECTGSSAALGKSGSSAEGTLNAYRKAEVVTGILIGLANILTTLFTLKAYAALPISIVAPAMSGGNMIFAALLGRLIYQEEFSKRTLFALILASISLILVNL